MEFKKKNEFNHDGSRGIIYDTDQSMNIDIMIKTLKQYENEQSKLFECICDTFSEEGNPYQPRIKKVENLDRMYEFENPSISVTALYINPNNNSYKFTISMANNARGMSCYFRDKDAEYVKRKIELSRMKKELEDQKKREQQKLNKDSYQK